MKAESTFFTQFLKNELSRRCEANPRYSVRAFARALGLDAGAVSRILSEKQIPSFKVAQKILAMTEATPEDRARFLASLAETQRARGMKRLAPVFRKMQTTPVPQELSIALYRVIADWYHVAILELTFVEGFKSDPRWIASQLGITAAEAKLAIDRLLRLELLEEKDGVFRKSRESYSTADKHLTTAALRKNQRQFLERATHSLENDPIDERSMTSMTMAIDPANLPRAKKMISRFNQDLCKVLEAGTQKRVYNLGIALYPLQVPIKEKSK